MDQPNDRTDKPRSPGPENGSDADGAAAPEETVPLRNFLKPSADSSPTDSDPARGNPAQPPPGPTRFPVGEVIAARYRITRFIGQGGMGDVYEAEDLELREAVALKTVRPEIASDPRALERFKREIQLSRRVTHPNVCRVFDLGYHRLASGEGITFLTMELLAGDTLSGRLRAAGRMTTAQALPLVVQMASALGAAHEAGIVHRDFKPGNVMLVPIKGNDSEFRAVVTDFGLARYAAGVENQMMTLSMAGEVMGTPAYMSPEQVEGKQLTGATDIYALGTVIFEMVTGRCPFAGDTPFSVAIKRLTEAPPSPRIHVADLDPRWEAVILRCLAREPEARFEKAPDIISALTSEALPNPSPAATPRKRALWIAAAFAGGLLAMLIALGAARTAWLGSTLRRLWSASSQYSLGSGKSRRSVAVLGFKNISGRPEQAWLSTALAEMVAIQLQSGGELRAIPGDDVAQMSRDLAISTLASLPPDQQARISENLGADLILVGWYSVQGDSPHTQIHLNIEIHGSSSGNSGATIEASGSEDNLPTLVNDVVARTLEKLHLHALPASVSEKAGTVLPSSPGEARLYSEAIEKLRNSEFVAARDLLQKLVIQDRDNATAHSTLAEAWRALGYDSRALEEAKAALDLSADLPPEQKALVTARYAEYASNWREAIETYKSLLRIFSDNLEYGLRLAHTQIEAGQGKEALATLNDLRKLPSPSGKDPRLDLVGARAASSLSDYKQAVALTNQCISAASARGARQLVAQANLEQCSALRQLGDTAQAKAACEKAQSAFADIGDLLGRARSLTRTANILEEQGDFAQSLELTNRALQIARQIGSQKDVAGALINLGNKQANQGDLESAKQSYLQSLAVSKEIDFKKNILEAQNNLGTVYQSLCDFEGAKDMFDQSRQTAEAIGDKARIAQATYNSGSVLFRLGDLAGARTRIESAIETAQKLGIRSDASDWLMTLGDLEVAEGNLAAAEDCYKRSLAMVPEGDTWKLAVNRLVTASLHLEREQPAEALPLARMAAEEFQKQSDPDNAASARVVASQALLAQGDHAGAKKELEEAIRLQPRDCELRLSIETTQARIMARTKQISQAREKLQGVMTEARSKKLVAAEMEAKLALGEIELRAGNARAARTSLESLQTQAKARNFNTIARKAASALEPAGN